MGTVTDRHNAQLIEMLAAASQLADNLRFLFDLAGGSMLDLRHGTGWGEVHNGLFFQLRLEEKPYATIAISTKTLGNELSVEVSTTGLHSYKFCWKNGQYDQTIDVTTMKLVEPHYEAAEAALAALNILNGIYTVPVEEKVKARSVLLATAFNCGAQLCKEVPYRVQTQRELDGPTKVLFQVSNDAGPVLQLFAREGEGPVVQIGDEWDYEGVNQVIQNLRALLLF